MNVCDNVKKNPSQLNSGKILKVNQQLHNIITLRRAVVTSSIQDVCIRASGMGRKNVHFNISMGRNCQAMVYQ